jgi:hypothetical protein
VRPRRDLKFSLLLLLLLLCAFARWGPRFSPPQCTCV